VLLALSDCLVNLKSEDRSNSELEYRLIENENLEELKQEGQLALWKPRCPRIGHYLQHEYWNLKAETVVVVLGPQNWKSEESILKSEERRTLKLEGRWIVSFETCWRLVTRWDRLVDFDFGLLYFVVWGVLLGNSPLSEWSNSLSPSIQAYHCACSIPYFP